MTFKKRIIVKQRHQVNKDNKRFQNTQVQIMPTVMTMTE